MLRPVNLNIRAWHIEYEWGTHTTWYTHSSTNPRILRLSVLGSIGAVLLCAWESSKVALFARRDPCGTTLTVWFGLFSKWGYCFCQYILASVHNIAKDCIGSSYNLTNFNLRIVYLFFSKIQYNHFIEFTRFITKINSIYPIHTQCAQCWSSNPIQPIHTKWMGGLGCPKKTKSPNFGMLLTQVIFIG